MKQRFMTAIALILTCVMMLGTLPVSAAEKSSTVVTTNNATNNQLYRLVAFGLIRDNTVFDFNANVTRSDAAYTIKQIISLDMPAGKDETISDISGDVNESEIYQVVNMGLMGCMHGNSFKPDMPVSYSDLLNGIMRAIGYNKLIDEEETFYSLVNLYSAHVGNMVKGRTDSIKWTEFMDMIDEVINADLLVRHLNGKDVNYYLDENKSILSEKLHIYKCRGTVTGTSFSGFYGNGATGENQIRIDDKVFVYKDLFTADLLGLYVDAWYMEDYDNGVNRLIYAQAYEYDDRVTEISSNKLLDFSMDSITYYRTETRKKTIALPDGIYLIYNGEAIDNYSDMTIDCKQGKIYLIDKDNNGTPDILSVLNYDKCVVSSVSYEYMVYDIHSASRNVDLSDEDIYVYKNGELADKSSIKPNDVLSILRDRHGKVKFVTVNTNTVSGKVDSVKNVNTYGCTKELIINGTAFKVDKTFNDLYHSGNYNWIDGAGTFYLDYNGVIVGHSEIKTGNLYAYMMKYYDDDIDEKVYIKMFGVNGIEKLTVANRAKINGVTCRSVQEIIDALDTATGSTQMLFRYKLNSKSELSFIETAINALVPTDDDNTFVNVGETAEEGSLREIARSDSGTYYAAISGIPKETSFSNDTLCFRVPADDSNDPDYFSMQKGSGLGDGGTVKYIAYATSNDSLISEVIVIKEATDPTALFKTSSPIGIVTEVTWGVTQDGETRRKLAMYERSGKSTVLEGTDGLLDSLSIGGESGEIQIGDVIKYETNKKGQMVAVKLLARVQADGTVVSVDDGSSDRYEFNGRYAYKKQGSVFAFISDTTTEAQARSKWEYREMKDCIVYMYDTASQTATKVTYNDIPVYKENQPNWTKVMFRTSYYKPTFAIVFK